MFVSEGSNIGRVSSQYTGPGCRKNVSSVPISFHGIASTAVFNIWPNSYSLGLELWLLELSSCKTEEEHHSPSNVSVNNTVLY